MVKYEAAALKPLLFAFLCFAKNKNRNNIYSFILTAEKFNVRINLELQRVQLYEIWAKKLEATHPLAGLNPQVPLPLL